MFRLKTLSVLAGMVAVLAVSAAPASAWFYATGQQWKGQVTITNAGVFSYGEGANRAEVKCVASEIKAQWSIQTKGQIKIHEKEEKQLQTKFGPHLHIQVKDWGKGCTAKIGAKGEALAAVVKPCELQGVDPQKGVATATGGVATECVIKGGGCEIHVPAGMEKEAGSGTGINVGLKEIEVENKENNLFGKINITGIRAEKQPNTPLCPLLSKSEEASLKGVEGELLGVNQQ